MRKILIAITIASAYFLTPIAAGAEVEIPETKVELIEIMETCQSQMEKDEALIEEIASKNDVVSSAILLKIANEDWEENNRIYTLCKEKYDSILQAEEDARWAAKFNEYQTATYVWRYLRGCGLSEECCAGILGNMMAEVGGQTLNLNWYLAHDGYYGLCQWKVKTYSKVDGASIHQQCEYLIKNIAYEINTYGKAYQKGFDYEDFTKLTSPEDAALAFAKSYERCGKASYKQRQKNARIAYVYFTS